MGELFAAGRIVDLILGLMMLEALVLIALRRRSGRGIAPLDLVASLLAGAMLLLALRFALTGAGWLPVAACLAAALVAHRWDLRRRWRIPYPISSRAFRRCGRGHAPPLRSGMALYTPRWCRFAGFRARLHLRAAPARKLGL